MPSGIYILLSTIVASITVLQLYFRLMATDRTLVVLGSGGHTAEMSYVLSMPGVLDRIAPVHYLIARGDNHSKAAALRLSTPPEANIHLVTRARRVHQPYYTAVFTTFLASLETAWLLICLRPRLVLANGPGTALPVLCLARLFRSLAGLSVTVVYIESFTRIKRLSTTARLSSWAIDSLIVNWEQLATQKNMLHIPLYRL